MNYFKTTSQIIKARKRKLFIRNFVLPFFGAALIFVFIYLMLMAFSI